MLEFVNDVWLIEHPFTSLVWVTLIRYLNRVFKDTTADRTNKFLIHFSFKPREVVSHQFTCFVSPVSSTTTSYTSTPATQSTAPNFKHN